MHHKAEELDRVFSIFTRVSHADHAGYVSCYTCGSRLEWKEAQNGHFIRRGHTSVRWSEDNCRPQCYICNMNKDGMEEAFEENLRDDLGDELVDSLIERGKQEARFPDEWYVDKIRFFKKQISSFGVII